MTQASFAHYMELASPPDAVQDAGNVADVAAPAAAASSTRSVDTVVVAIIAAYHQAKVRDGEGNVYALTARTRGLDWAALQEGQRVTCTVTRRLPRVVSASAVA